MRCVGGCVGFSGMLLSFVTTLQDDLQKIVATCGVLVFWDAFVTTLQDDYER